LAAITDEFSFDPAVAAKTMSELGMTGAELRMIGERNVLDLTDGELDAVVALFRASGLEVIGVASPLLKCTAPGAHTIDPRLHHDVFGAPYTLDDQPRLMRRAFEVAERTGAKLVRVFSFWRTTDPEACFDEIAAALHGLAQAASQRGLTIGLENEFACNVGTGAELGAILAMMTDQNVCGIWDPANAVVLGERAFPDGYACLDIAKLGHVHAKDCTAVDGVPSWEPIGSGDVGWPAQLRALFEDGYRGWISLETHWRGESGNRLDASIRCTRHLIDLLGRAALDLSGA
jgi:sugar phosphate isomerase/epimerase